MYSIDNFSKRLQLDFTDVSCREKLLTEWSEFIFIVCSGLAESVVAAACSRVGQRVLHVDRRSYYAANWASFTFTGLLTWIQQHQVNAALYMYITELIIVFLSQEDEEEAKSPDPPNTTEEEKGVDEDAAAETSEEQSAGKFGTEFHVKNRFFTVADLQLPDSGEEEETEETAGVEQPTRKKISYAHLVKEGRRFNIDLVSKLMYSRGSLVDLLIKSNVSRYAEFKNVSRVLTYRHGNIEQVPCSRADVFASRQLSVVEKRKLMRFLTSCVEETEQQQAYNGQPYLEFLRDQKLGENLEHFLLHSIAMVTEDAPTEDGLAATRHFLRSLGRYGNTPFLFPVYGLGEIPQCFCRMCAVFGGIYCLRHSVHCLLVDKDTNRYKCC
uniref:Rab proteins geranylgeranyltransferase component A n=1 Tax=Anabas testudineus TaxID=64144 RepID=A0AAQ6IH19_ANATE